MDSIVILYDLYSKEQQKHERFGQWFVNRFVVEEDSVTRLMWEMDVDNSWNAISDWLIDHDYFDTLPPNCGSIKIENYVE